MRMLLTFLLSSIFVSSTTFIDSTTAVENRLTPEQIAAGWISLFDGETLFGWKPTSDVDWQVREGAIQASEGKAGWLMSTSQFADYELHLEFKAPATTNSGIFLRSLLNPKNPTHDCYEVNIAPADNPFPTGALVGRKKWESDLPWTSYPPPNVLQDIEVLDTWDGHWHVFDITMMRNKVRIQCDGHLFHEYIDPQPRLAGYIGLQFREGEIAFRNIRLKPLGTKPLLNGKDLTGWNTERAEASRFEVTPAGELRVLDGRGQIESEASFADFVLQTDCYINGDALNSGIFFRCIPRDFMMGYECQIHNGKVDGDPTQPQDCGTGGIFRRQNARRIVAQDRQWFTITLAADGPHMAAWVNGTQVSDWTDTRAPHENPRKGLRLQPGTLALQGHDPTTDLRFKNMRLAELSDAKD
ncbi:MAG TPA: DUF1080 domain-containing protein [Planctomycetaceae bacterium]|nr:DUF1080 domain-containing protein [Planctomycetaceae bacterium]